MGKIERYEVHEEWNHSGLVKAGDYCFLSYCVGNIGGTIEEQINGAFDNMEERLAMVGLTLENVVQMDCLFRDVYNIPVMEKVLRKGSKGNILPGNPSRRILPMSEVRTVCISRLTRSHIADDSVGFYLLK